LPSSTSEAEISPEFQVPGDAFILQNLTPLSPRASGVTGFFESGEFLAGHRIKIQLQKRGKLQQV
jgi:hypothetical protein